MARCGILSLDTRGGAKGRADKSDKAFLEVDLESTVTASGKAERHQDPPEDWHFDATATVVEHRPIVQMFESTTGTRVDIVTVYDPEKNTQAAGSGADASNNNQPAPPPPPPPPVGPPPPPPQPFSTFDPGQGNRDGDTECSAPLPSGEAELKVRAQASWTSSGGPSSARNTKVFNEELKVSFTFKSYLE